MKREIFYRYELAPWCRKLPASIIRIILIIVFPLCFVYPLIKRETLKANLSDWWKMLIGVYKARGEEDE